MNSPISLLALFIGYLIATPVLAQTREAAVIETFAAFCTEALPDFSIIDSKATGLKLRVLKENFPDVGDGRSSKFRVWQVPSVAGTYVLIVSEFATEANTSTTCRVSASNAKGSETRNAVTTKLNLPAPDGERLVSKDFKDKQITWKMGLGNEEVLVTLLHPNPDGLGIDLSLTRKSKGKPELAPRTRETGPIECSLRVVQDGKEIMPEVSEKISSFKLVASDFKIEVSPPACSPSITLTDRHQVAYLTQTPVVFSTGGYWVAGDTESADMLASAAALGNARTTVEEEIEYATSDVSWAQEQYRSSCSSLGYCPTPAKTFATAWPFLDPETKENRGFAEFKRIDKFRSLGQVSGSVIVAVVYSNWKVISNGDKWSEKRLYLLKPHAIAFDFR